MCLCRVNCYPIISGRCLLRIATVLIIEYRMQSGGHANRSINKPTTRSCSAKVQIAWNTPPSYLRLSTSGYIQLGSESNSYVVDDTFMFSVSECAGPAGRETHCVFTNQRTCNSVKKHRISISVVSRAIQNCRTTPAPNKILSLVFSN